MVTIQQVKTGITRYIDNDMLPKLSGFRRIGLGVYSALAAENATDLILKYKDHPAVSMLGVINENNEVDIDKLYNAVYPMFSDGQKQSINIPLIGEYYVDNTDIEKIYRYIRG